MRASSWQEIATLDAITRTNISARPNQIGILSAVLPDGVPTERTSWLADDPALFTALAADPAVVALDLEDGADPGRAPARRAPAR